MDEQYGRDATKITKTQSFDLPIKKSRNGEYKIRPGSYIYTCFSSDFFIEEADGWRQDAWRMMKLRKDVDFFIITKRIHRFKDCIPPDWDAGYDNVTICSTVENQDRADFRLPILLSCPIKHREIICEPLLGQIDLGPYLKNIEGVTVGGESGPDARVCDYAWVVDLREQCAKAKVRFWFKQTGARFLKDGKVLTIPRSKQFSEAAKLR